MALRNLARNHQAAGWVPTITDVDNVAASVLLGAFYAVSGNLVNCWVSMTIDMTAAAVYAVRLSLPHGIAIAAASDIIGTCAPVGGAFGGTVVGDPTNNEALCDSQNGTTGVETVQAHFAYRMP
jgi:predicted membrane protein